MSRVVVPQLVRGQRVRYELAILGPTIVKEHGVIVALRPRELDVLAALALHHPNSVSIDAIADVLWATPPATVTKTVQMHVARLRRTLGPDAIVTEGASYRLGPEWELDADRLEGHLARARRSTRAGDYSMSRVLLEAARTEVRGQPFAALPATADTMGERARREQQLLAADEDLVMAYLATQDTSAAVALAVALVEAEPHRENRWMMLALGQYRNGQRRDSLRTLRRGREAALEIAGLTTSVASSRLESWILADDPVLERLSPAELVGHSDPSEPGDLHQLFIGRSELLDSCAQRLRNVMDNQAAHAIVLSGQEGIGKSAFVAQLAVRGALDGWSVVWATCRPNPSLALEPLGDIARQILDAEAHPLDVFDTALVADLATLRGDSSRPPIGDLGEVMAELVALHIERTPTLIIIDDAEHLTATVRHILERIVELPGPLAVIAVTDASHVDGAAESIFATADRIVLQGLDAAETRRLLEAISAGPISAEVAASACTATGGNPLILRGLAATLATNAMSGDEIGSAVTSNATAIAQHALQCASTSVRRVASLLAVASSSTSPTVIGDVASNLDSDTSKAEVNEAIAEGIRSGLFRTDPNGAIDLASDGLRRAVLDAMPPDPQMYIHELLGLALTAAGAGPLAIAPHLLAASSRDVERAINAATAAGEAARAATMFIEAAAYFAQAATLADHPRGGERHLLLQLERAECLRLAADSAGHEIAWQVARQAEQEGLADLTCRAATALCQLGPSTLAGRLDVELAALVERALNGCSDRTLRTACMSQASLFYSMSGDVGRTRAHFLDALDIARTNPDDTLRAHVLSNAYTALTHPDDWPLRRQLAGELLALAEDLDSDQFRFEALHLYYSVQVQFPDPLLRTTFVRQTQLAGRLRGAAHRWMLGYQAACLAYLDGRLEEALTISVATQEQSHVSASRSDGNHAILLFAVRLAQDRGQELFSAMDSMIIDQPGLPGWRAVAAWLAALRGDRTRVLAECEALDDGLALPHDTAWSGAAMLLGRAIAACGTPEQIGIIEHILQPMTGLMTWIGSCTVGAFDVALAELALARNDADAARRHLAVARQSIILLGARVYEPDLDHIASRIPNSESAQV